MDEEVLNTSVRKFLRKLGVTAQREIEIAVRDADTLSRSAGSISNLRSTATLS